MTYDKEDTVVALSTPPGSSALAVIRISGERTSEILRKLIASNKNHPCDRPFKACKVNIRSTTGHLIDTAVVVYFSKPRSFTGEDVAEVYCHGNALIVEQILSECVVQGARLAQGGEFTRRAFENGKIDLVQAEAISDLINAESWQAVKLANEQLQGRLSLAVIEIGEPLREVLAQIEAYIDFPEEDIDPLRSQVLIQELSVVVAEIDRLLSTYSSGLVVREGLRVLLCGRPNAGKSSLLNSLLQRSRAIVTDIAGTTRDIIEEKVVIDGYSVVLCDSAGITQTVDPVEMIGVELALDRVKWADVICVVVDSANLLSDDATDEMQELIELLDQALLEVQGVDDLTEFKKTNVWLVLNKIDLLGGKLLEGEIAKIGWPGPVVRVSCQSDNVQIEELRDSFVRYVSGEAKRTGGQHTITPTITNLRQKSCLDLAERHVGSALSMLKGEGLMEIIAEELRLGLRALEEIVGKTYSDDILGRIFAKFCIGK
jgi:tRNA modification GTPase